MAPLVLVGAVVGAGGFAAYRSYAPASSDAITAATAAAAPAQPIDQAGAQGEAPPLPEGHSDVLPPNHPPIDSVNSPQSPHGGANGAAGMPGAGASDDNAAIAWKAPDAWKSVPNPNQMRLQTWKIPAAKGDAEDAEVAISRAGGSTDANIDRWLGQFDDHGKETRTEKKVAGFKVTTLDVTGTYKGMMSDANAAPKKNWEFVAAIVEVGSGESYFFKMTGPAATVKSSRAKFDGMIDGIKPKS